MSQLGLPEVEAPVASDDVGEEAPVAVEEILRRRKASRTSGGREADGDKHRGGK